MMNIVAIHATTIDDPQKFMSLASDYHRALVMPYCGISFRQSLLQFSTVPLSALNIHKRKILLQSGDMGVSTLANCDISEDETIFTVCGPLVSEANVYTVQVDQERHMIFSGGAEFLAHSCQPNVKLVIEKLDTGKSVSHDMVIDEENVSRCLPNLVSSINFPEWWSAEHAPTNQVMFQSVYAINVVALRNIKEGELLSFNYLTTEYDMDEKFTCLCGGAEDFLSTEDKTSLPRCFGTIKGYRHLPNEYKLLLKPLCTSVVLRCAEEEKEDF